MSSGTVFPLRPSAPRTSVTGSSPLLPTPTRVLGTASSAAWRTGYRGEPTLQGLAVALLPTPSATPYGNNQSPSPGAAVRPSLDGPLRLLPTPLGREGRPDGGGNARGQGSLERGGGIMLSQAVKLLPTPTRGEGKGARSLTAPDSRSGTFDPGMTLTDLAFLWESNGATTSPPSDAGKRSPALLLNPCFVEWMLGLPAGWSDPDCPDSATEFKSAAATSPADTSSIERNVA